MSYHPPALNRDSHPLFREEQRFTQPWVWAVALGTAGLCWWLALTVPGGGGADLIAFVMLIVVGIATPALFLAMRLTTEVRSDGVYIRYFPFHLRFKRFGFEEIDRIEARQYSPLLDYGGWGIRLGMHGWAYNVKGDMGMQIVMRSGKRVLIGTQRPEEFMAAVTHATA